jgi:hypothetical protein
VSGTGAGALAGDEPFRFVSSLFNAGTEPTHSIDSAGVGTTPADPGGDAGAAPVVDDGGMPILPDPDHWLLY